MGHMAKRFDVVRLDHFRGLESFWAVPYGDKTAVNGSWHKGPGMAWVNAIKKAHPNLSIIAEDLGVITPQVKNLLSASGYPGMRVMQFGFEPYQNSLNLPHNYPQNCVAYIGTHDNTTCMDWVLNADPQELGFAVQYLGLNTVEGFNFGFVRGLMTSAASLAIVQMQDYLAQDGSCRMNLPGTIGWWTYRCKPDCFTPALQQRIARYTLMSGRG